MRLSHAAFTGRVRCGAQHTCTDVPYSVLASRSGKGNAGSILCVGRFSAAEMRRRHEGASRSAQAKLASIRSLSHSLARRSQREVAGLARHATVRRWLRVAEAPTSSRRSEAMRAGSLRLCSSSTRERLSAGPPRPQVAAGLPLACRTLTFPLTSVYRYAKPLGPAAAIAAGSIALVDLSSGE